MSDFLTVLGYLALTFGPILLLLVMLFRRRK